MYSLKDNGLAQPSKPALGGEKFKIFSESICDGNSRFISFLYGSWVNGDYNSKDIRIDVALGGCGHDPSVGFSKGGIGKTYIYYRKPNSHFVEEKTGTNADAALSQLLLNAYNLAVYCNEHNLTSGTFAETARFSFLMDLRRNFDRSSKITLVQNLVTTGYIDVIEGTSSGCRMRFLSGDKSYTGIIGFDRLSVLTRRRIRTYEDALAFFEGKQIRATLSGLTAPGNFTGMSQLTVVASPGPKSTRQQWKETTTATETIIDLSTDILFDFNKSTINPKAVPSLIKLARLLRQSNGNNIQLNGFTDSIGTDEYNIGLSQRRSEAVKQWLVSKGGIDGSRLNTNGYGKAQPVAPNSNADGSDNPAGRQKNRRVEIRIPRS